jgi:hypothetical protein
VQRSNEIDKVAADAGAIINDPNFDRKLDLITAGAKPFLKEHLLTKITRENCQIIINYVLAFHTDIRFQFGEMIGFLYGDGKDDYICIILSL